MGAALEDHLQAAAKSAVLIFVNLRRQTVLDSEFLSQQIMQAPIRRTCLRPPSLLVPTVLQARTSAVKWQQSPDVLLPRGTWSDGY